MEFVDQVAGLLDALAETPGVGRLIGFGGGVFAAAVLWREIRRLKRRAAAGNYDEPSPRDWATDAARVRGNASGGDVISGGDPSLKVACSAAETRVERRTPVRLGARAQSSLRDYLTLLRPVARVIAQRASQSRDLTEADLAAMQLAAPPSSAVADATFADLDDDVRSLVGRIRDDYDALRSAVARLPELGEERPLDPEWTAFLHAKVTALVETIEGLQPEPDEEC